MRLDYGGDYVSDIARMWPVNGKFSTQSSASCFSSSSSIATPSSSSASAPSVETRQIMAEAKKEMEAVFQKTKFSKPIYHKGGGPGQCGVSRTRWAWRSTTTAVTPWGPLRPGHVFSIDPQLRVPEEGSTCATRTSWS